MMRRREFARGLAGGLAAGVLSPLTARAQAPGAGPTRKNNLMHIGGDYHSVAGSHITGKENLEYNLRHGVRHLTVSIPAGPGDGSWSRNELSRMKDDCDRLGMILEAIRMDDDYIRMRPGAERDRKLEIIRRNIQLASQVGVRIITYHWRVIPIRRNREVQGRGGVTYSGFKLEENWRDLPLTASGRVSSEDYWERITYFLQNIIPAARENDVRMACHPYDPPGLPFGYQGAENWDSPSIFDAIRRYESIVDSPYNGFQLCLGTTAEGLADPKREILPIVRYLGERGKIYQIHMRNIRGGLNDFSEVYPDEGDVDFFEVMRILRDTQFAGALCPDHMPTHAGDPKRLQAFAFGYGYIRALIQAVNAEVPEA